ncbi:class I SAM-dependent methyltransferase, partial [Actinomadura sp. SCN-SB]|uniref:class I SAM-dependent methyltransferase n=1 Tax=Actinomadura sp. SCN-SB TaxID=3373092 RepID=UPI00375378B3
TADRTGFPDAQFDCVVSVNNVAIWPDLRAGLRELHRVTAPGGRVVIAWHGGTHPSRIARSKALPDSVFAEIERELSGLFSSVSRDEFPTLTVLSAVR